MDDAVAATIIEGVAREQLAVYREELTEHQIMLVSDQIAREAWRRLKRDLRKTRQN